MSSVTKSLCWKEFHELKWETAAAAAIALSIPLCYVFRDASAAFLGVHTAFTVYPLLAGVFYGMRAAAGERTNRTTSFVAALPVPVYVLGSVRLSAALIAAAIPLLVLLCLGAALSPFADQSSRNMLPLTATFGWSMLATACCLTIVAVAGLGQPTEVRAAVVGVATIIGLWLVVFLAMVLIGAFLASIENRWFEAGAQWVTICGFISMAGLFLLLPPIFTSRYPRALASEPLVSGTRRRWRISDWTPRPISAQVATLIWKGSREMGFLGLQVFVVSLLLSMVVGGLGLTDSEPTSVTQIMTRALPAMLWVGGFVLAILIGVGAVISDLQPGVNTFWRSRPISPRAWYWTKYGIGLATLFVAIEVPFLLNPGAYDLSDSLGLLWWPLIWNVTFSFAFTATCLVRQPAQAAILAVGAAGLLYSAVQAGFGSFTPGEPGAPLAILVPVFCCALIVSTVLGWWAAARDFAIS